MDYNYHEYRHIMSYSSYTRRKKLWSLPFIYKWYVKYLYELYWDGIAYSRFAKYYQELWYEFIKLKVAYNSHKKQFKRFGDYYSYIVSLKEK